LQYIFNTMKLPPIHQYFRWLLLAIGALSAPSMASKSTVNPHGGADYVFLDSALSAITRNTSPITVDTLLIAGADQTDTLNWSFNITRQNYPGLVVRSTAANPDSFPFIKRSGPLGWDFQKTMNLAFENLTFFNAKATGRNFAWTNGQSTDKTHRFRNCVIKDQTDNYFFGMEGNNNTTIIFENCLFENNALVFFIQFWNGSPTLKLINCTFDNNAQIFDSDFDNNRAGNISIMNCIFSGRTSYFQGSVLKGKTSYSLTSEALAGYGANCVSNATPRYKNSTRDIASDWMITYSQAAPSPANNIGNPTGALPTDISGYARISKPDAGCWEIHPKDFAWDASAATGIQGGNGNWGGPAAGSYWTYDTGATRIAWPGAGSSATLGGSDGAYTVTVAPSQYVDSLVFMNDGYTLSGGSIAFTNNNSVVVAAGKTGNIESAIAGAIGLRKLGNGTLSLVGANTYTGTTTISAGNLSIANLASGGLNSGIGSSDGAAANLLIDGGVLSYIGAAQTCDRLFTVGAGGATISASGIGGLVLSNAGTISFSGTGARTLTLAGSNTGNNTLAAAIGNGAAATSLVKNGAGAWRLSAANTYTGATTVSAGKLIVGGSIGGSAVTVASGALLCGTGSLGGATTINGGLLPGENGTGILTVNNNLAFSSTGSYECAIEGATAGSSYDQVVVAGALSLGNATLALNLGYGPIAGQSYTIIDNDGVDDVTGTFSGLPEGKRIILSFNGTSYSCSISYKGGTGNDVVVTVVSVATDYFWDLSSAAGYQGGSGAWGTAATWSADGVTLVSWPGAGNTATFTGADNVCSIAINGVQSVDSMTFLTGGYTMTGGSINLGTHSGIYVAPLKSAVVSSVIDGTGGLSKYGSGTLVLSGTNTYSGTTAISAGTVQLGDGGETGSVAGPIDNKGALIFNRGNTYIFSAPITGNGTITKTGAGALKLSSSNSCMGALTVSSGALVVNGSLPAGCTMTVGPGATLGGSGSCGGPVIANGAIITPGDGGPGKLTLGSLALSGASTINFDMGNQSDTIAVTGNLSLSGTFNLSPLAGFASRSYTLLTCDGVITSYTPIIGTAPAGKGYALVLTEHAVSVLCTTAIISIEPRDTAVVIGRNCSFSLSAAGTGTLTYQWIKASATVPGTGPTLSFAQASIADSGRYRCIVSDSFGIDTSRWVYLSIIVPPNIATQPTGDTVFVGETARFRLTAQGTAPLSYVWHKHGNGADSALTGAGDSLSIPAATFADSGAYYCVVANSGGLDTSVTVRLAVKHVPPTQADAKPDSCSVFTGDTVGFTVTAAGTAPFAFEWHKVGMVGDGIAGARDTLRFSPATLSDSGKYFCIVRNPAGADSSDTVLLKVKHIPPRNADILPDSLTVFPGANVGFTAIADGTHPLVYRWFKVCSGGDSSLTATGDTLRIDSSALTMAGKYYCIISNPGGSDTSDTAVLRVNAVPPSAADIRPDTINAIAGQSTALKVTASGALPFMYAWHRVRKGVDSLLTNATDSLKISSASCADSGLYYCIVSNPGGADTSDTALLSVRLLLPSTALIRPDTARVTAGQPVVFRASVSGSPPFTYAWYKVRKGDDSLLSAAGDSLKFVSATLVDSGAYYYIVGNKGGTDTSSLARLMVVPRAPKASFSLAPKSGTAPLTVAFTDASSGDISSRLWKFGDDSSASVINPTHTYLRAGQYSVTLIVTGPGGSDSLKKKDSVSALKDTGASPFKQMVAFFDSTKIKDTVSAFDGKVVVWKDSEYTVKTLLIDTLQIVKFGGTAPKGMIVVGTPVVFRKAAASRPMFIGIRVDSLPPNKSLYDVRMYSDSAGAYSVHYGTGFDSTNKIVYVKTADLTRPFLAMIDTMTPGAAFLSDTGAYIVDSAKLSDSLRIFDNIANVEWQYFCGKGSEIPKLRKRSEAYHTGNSIVLAVSDTMNAISPESGLRAYVVITDGVHTDTINISRSVLRAQSDKQTIAAFLWTPVYPTAKLFNPSGDSLITLMSRSGISSYDQRSFRLYRWAVYDGNKDIAEKWVEYDPKQSIVRALFTLEPGTLVWLKTRDTMQVHLSSGVTLSLKDTLRVDLPARQWTDFGMPYRFGVRIQEILSASGKDADSLLFFRWNREGTSPLFFLVPVYVPGMPDNLDPSKTIEYAAMSGYSIFNQSSKMVTMRVPPVAAVMGNIRQKTAKAGTAGWCAKFLARNGGGALPAVYFGYAPGIAKSAYPSAPSFSSLRLSVFDRKTAVRYGHHIGQDAKAGLIRELLISNDADTAQTIRFHLEKVGAFPETYASSCYDASTNKFESEGTLIIAPKSVASRMIVIGDASFQKRFLTAAASLRFSLHSIFPNPARSAVSIRYTVPFGAQERLRIDIYTMQGKRLWEKRLDGFLVEGEHTVTWNGRNSRQVPATSGLYLVRLTVISQRGQAVKQFEQRVTLMK
jgi:autotransporter-associated beta strand protein